VSGINAYNYKLRQVSETMEVSSKLASHFANPERHMTGIYELILNAIEHGNLEIGYERKAELVRAGSWRQEIEQRILMPQYSTRAVNIRLIHDDKTCCLTISDDGHGFRWQEYVRGIAAGKRPNGRGLLIAFNSNFDSIKFNDKGNAVTCIGKRKRASI